jgi:phospholipase C
VLDPGWVTYPEVLLDAGVSWKYYSTPDADTQENPLVNFKQYYPGYSSDPALNARAAQLFDRLFGQSYENFLTDAAAGNLPQVSWVNTHVTQQEHPSAAPQDGEVALQAIVDAVTANPLTWPKTVVFYTYDENGGFFDHVPPPTAPAGTSGEFVRNSNGTYDTLPIGLGFRVPMLIISPFSRGGFVARHVFDHTSQLRFVERWLTAKGVSSIGVPNLSAWRRSIVGDLTSALNFAAPNNSLPTLGLQQPVNLADHPECATEEVSMAASPTPTSQSLPAQEPGRRPSPSGLRKS